MSSFGAFYTFRASNCLSAFTLIIRDNPTFRLEQHLSGYFRQMLILFRYIGNIHIREQKKHKNDDGIDPSDDYAFGLVGCCGLRLQCLLFVAGKRQTVPSSPEMCNHCAANAVVRLHHTFAHAAQTVYVSATRHE